MQALLGLSNEGVSVEVLGLAAGLDFTETFTDHGLSLAIAQQGGGGGEPPPPATVPEPPSLALLCAALLLLLRSGRRAMRRKA
jgi:hypothetical protein